MNLKGWHWSQDWASTQLRRPLTSLRTLANWLRIERRNWSFERQLLKAPQTTIPKCLQSITYCNNSSSWWMLSHNLAVQEHVMTQHNCAIASRKFQRDSVSINSFSLKRHWSFVRCWCDVIQHKAQFDSNWHFQRHEIPTLIDVVDIVVVVVVKAKRSRWQKQNKIM